MKNGDETYWTIDELGERVAEALSGPGYEGVSSGRVRDVPDLRTIRYYTTLGLLDRPAAMRGRTALYGPRHLLQLVAIKRLQARGLSLTAVQERVVGLSDAALGRLADEEGAVTKVDAVLPPPASESRGESFWRVQPEHARRSRRLKKHSSAQEVPLGTGLVLSMAAGRTLDEDDLRVIRMAAAPLIEILRTARADRRRPTTTKHRRRAMTMTRFRPVPLLDDVRPASRSDDRSDLDAGFGALETSRGRLPLAALDVKGRIDGLLSQVTVRQTFVNATDEPLEATYIFPLPDRAAVTDFRMEVGRASGRGCAQGARAGSP